MLEALEEHHLVDEIVEQLKDTPFEDDHWDADQRCELRSLHERGARCVDQRGAELPIVIESPRR